MYPIFYTYNKEINIEYNVLDKLIDLFYSLKITSAEIYVGKKQLFHKYNWPDIVLTEGSPVLPKPLGNGEYVIEALGTYHPKRKDSDGYIKLYVNKIHETAEYFLNDTQSKINNEKTINAINNLTTIILIHEFTHWLMDNLITIVKKNESMAFDCNCRHQYNDDDSIYFHESVAQIFTNYFSHQNESLKDVFIWLEKKQPKAYTSYPELFLDNGAKVQQYKISEGDAQNTILAIMLLRVNNERDSLSQSFKALNEIFNLIKVSEITSAQGRDILANLYHFSDLDIKSGDIQDILKNNRGQIMGKKFGF